MGNHQHGAVFVAQLAAQLHHAAVQIRRKPAGGLVQYQQPGRSQQFHGDGNPLFLPAGKVCNHRFFPPAQVNGFNSVGHSSFDLGAGGIACNAHKAALGVLAGLTADELRFAVLSDDIKTISKAPGIGKKTAQKLILELKDKLKLEDAFEKKLAHEQEAASVSGFLIHDGRQEAAEALIALGYSSTDAMKAVRKVTDVSPDDVEALLKAALKQL